MKAFYSKLSECLSCHSEPSSTSSPTISTNIFTEEVFTVKYESFNLTGVCWTVCCLTYTTCSTVHIHSFHKKYILVYTAFTISYNRAVAGTCVWMNVFVTMMQCPQNTSDPLIIQQCHPIIMCHVFTSLCVFALLQPGAVSLVNSAVSLCFVCLCSCLSIHFVGGPVCTMSPTPPGSCDVIPGSSRRAELNLFSCPLPSSSQPPASVTSPLCLNSC